MPVRSTYISPRTGVVPSWLAIGADPDQMVRPSVSVVLVELNVTFAAGPATPGTTSPPGVIVFSDAFGSPPGRLNFPPGIVAFSSEVKSVMLALKDQPASSQGAMSIDSRRAPCSVVEDEAPSTDRKSTRLNSSH